MSIKCQASAVILNHGRGQQHTIEQRRMKPMITTCQGKRAWCGRLCNTEPGNGIATRNGGRHGRNQEVLHVEKREPGMAESCYTEQGRSQATRDLRQRQVKPIGTTQWKGIARSGPRNADEYKVRLILREKQESIHELRCQPL